MSIQKVKNGVEHKETTNNKAHRDFAPSGAKGRGNRIIGEEGRRT